MMKIKFLLFLTLSPLLILFSCSKHSHELPQKDILKVSFHMDPLTLDARKSGDFISSTMIFMLFDGLMKLEKDGTLSYALAEKHSLSADGLTYTFTLRDAFWSDNTPITAYDFEKSWKEILSPSFPSLCPHLLYCIKNAEKVAKNELPIDQLGVQAKNEKTLVVTLEAPTPYFLSLTSFCVFFPIPTHIDESNPHWAQDQKSELISSGPFILKKWKRNDEIFIEKNPRYWNKEIIALDGIHISIVDSPNTALEMFQNKQLDWIGKPISPLPLDAAQALKKEKGLTIEQVGGLSFCAFNVHQSPFNNKNIRKAFSLAIDREGIVENVTQLEESPAYRAVPPSLCKNDTCDFLISSKREDAIEYLKKGLDELNISKEDFRVTLAHGSNELQKKLAQSLADEWEKTLNINIQLDQAEDKTHWDRLHNHNFQIGLTLLVVQYFDSMNIFERFKYQNHSKNYSAWENPTYISLLDAASYELNTTKRDRLLLEAEKLFLDEMPIAPIYHYTYATLQHEHVNNIGIGPLGDIHLEKATFKK